MQKTDPKDTSLQDFFLKKQKLDDAHKTEPKNTSSPMMQEGDVKAKHATTPQNPKNLSSSPNVLTTEGQMQQMSTSAGATTAASLYNYNKSSVHSKNKKEEQKLS